MFGRLVAWAALLAVAKVVWAARPGPVLRRVARVVGLLIVLAFVGSLGPNSTSDPVMIYLVGVAWYVGLALTRWRRKRHGTWPSEPQRWPAWFIASAA